MKIVNKTNSKHDEDATMTMIVIKKYCDFLSFKFSFKRRRRKAIQY
jgi:hypothetical protein